MPDVWAVQCAPPSLVETIVPFQPAAQPCAASAKETDCNQLDVFDVCGVHVAPPSTVARMVPALPTTHPWVALAKVIEANARPENVCAVQWLHH